MAQRHLPYPRLEWPLQISGSQYAPVAWSDIAGWSEDDHLQAFKAFRLSCKPISAQQTPPDDTKALGASLRDPCRAARAADISDGARAKAFFEEHFLPLRISRLGEDDGFVTGYYEPVIDGSRTQTDVYTVPVYRRPSNLFVRGFKQDSPSLPNKGQVFRKIGRRKLVPYYDRAEIEDGAIAGRGLEICWLKSQTDLLFAQIQGSARVRLEDGSTIRINYDAHNGYPYTAVGRILIDRGIIPKEQMSMQKIREWMEQNPDGANEVRRQNRAYVFFREVQLSDKDEAVGAQGVPLTPGRSIAVDQVAACLRHAVFHRGRAADRIGAVEDAVPPADDRAGHGVGDHGPGARRSLFRRRRRAGKGIRPPAAQHAFRHSGAQEPRSGRRGAARCRCRIRGRRRRSQSCFRKLDPVERMSRRIRPRGAKPARPAATVAQASAAPAAKPVPLPEARPDIKPVREPRRHRRYLPLPPRPMKRTSRPIPELPASAAPQARR